MHWASRGQQIEMEAADKQYDSEPTDYPLAASVLKQHSKT
jgi:hypothetical protein